MVPEHRVITPQTYFQLEQRWSFQMVLPNGGPHRRTRCPRTKCPPQSEDILNVLGISWGYDVDVNNVDVILGYFCDQQNLNTGVSLERHNFGGNHGSHAPTSTSRQFVAKWLLPCRSLRKKKKHLKPSPIIEIVSKYRFYRNPYWIFLGNIPKNLGYIYI